MASYLTRKEEIELADRMADDYLNHHASIRVLMFQEGLSYGAVRRLLADIAGVDLRGRGGNPARTAARDQFDDLEPDDRERLADLVVGKFAVGGRITRIAEHHDLHPYTVLRLLRLRNVQPRRRLNRAPYGSRLGHRRRTTW